MYRSSKQVHIEVESNETRLNDDRSLESFRTVVLLVSSLSCIILRDKIMGSWADSFFVAIRLFHFTKCPADRILCRTKPNFDFFSRTNVRCPALFQGLTAFFHIETWLSKIAVDCMQVLFAYWLNYAHFRYSIGENSR